MVDVQDGDPHTHKRTAIPQLLNPVSSSPTKRQEEHGLTTYRGAFTVSASVPQSDLTLHAQICRPQVRPPSTSVPQIGDQETPPLQAPSITLLLQTPMAAFVAGAPVIQHMILGHGLMMATAI